MVDLDGKTWSSSDFTGRTVVLNFWATWCPPCVAEIADLAQFSRQHDTNRIVVIGASVDEMPSDGLRQNVQALKIPYPVLRVTPEVAHAFGNVHALPTTFVIGPDGAFVAQHVGLITRKQLDAIAAPLLR